MNEQETSHDATGQLPPQSAQRANGSRVAIALACWLLSIIGILMSLMMIVGVSIASLLTKPISEVIQSRSFYLGVGTAYAWTALAVMTSSWVSNRPDHERNGGLVAQQLPHVLGCVRRVEI